jgi:hypothetical protein
MGFDLGFWWFIKQSIPKNLSNTNHENMRLDYGTLIDV